MTDWLTPSEISEIFVQTVAAVDGKVTDAFLDEARLFTRCVLPPSIEVGPGDNLQGGVALCATDTDVFVHPYVFRVVCTNGAIMAKATQTRHIARESWMDGNNLGETIREAVAVCCAPESFVMAAGQIRSAQTTAADLAITMAAFAGSHGGSGWVQLVGEIMRRYAQASDRSSYALMNAITSVARDTSDPQDKWRLEELGGSVPAMLPRPTAAPLRSRSRVRPLVEVG